MKLGEYSIYHTLIHPVFSRRTKIHKPHTTPTIITVLISFTYQKLIINPRSPRTPHSSAYYELIVILTTDPLLMSRRQKKSITTSSELWPYLWIYVRVYMYIYEYTI